MDLDLKSKLMLYSQVIDFLLTAEDNAELLRMVKMFGDEPMEMSCMIDGPYKEYIVGPIKVQVLDSNPENYKIYLRGDKIGEINVR